MLASAGGPVAGPGSCLCGTGKGQRGRADRIARQRLADLPAAGQVTLRVDPSLGHPEGFSIQGGRAADYPLQAISAGSQTRGELNATFWKFPLGGAWTVPAVESSGVSPSRRRSLWPTAAAGPRRAKFHGSSDSLKEILEANWTYAQAPTLCSACWNAST